MLLVVLFILDLLFGSVSIPLHDILNALTGKSQEINNGTRVIISEFRLPKAITAIITGIALSVSGLQMQTIFRNPLAGPYVLGISSGAGLGVAILLLGFSSYLQVHGFSVSINWAMASAAWIGSGIILTIS